jgi:hypothetical protein
MAFGPLDVPAPVAAVCIHVRHCLLVLHEAVDAVCIPGLAVLFILFCYPVGHWILGSLLDCGIESL